MTLLLLAGAPPPAAAQVIEPGQGVRMAQVDWTYPGAELADSRFGLLSVDFPRLARATGIRSGYLNLLTDQGWVVRNLPILADLRCAGLSTMFDLGAGSGDVQQMNAVVLISATPRLGPPTLIGPIPFPVGAAENNAQGVDALRTLPPQVPFLADLADFLPSGLISAVVQEGHPSVEQDVNQCAPAAVANSLQWLEDEYDTVTVPHSHVPGIDGEPTDSLVGQLDRAMGRKKGQAVGSKKAIEGKLDYIGDNGLSDDLVIKHWGGASVPGDVSSSGVTSSDEGDDEGAPSLFDWIVAELEAGEDVELAMGYAGGGGHMVDVTAAGRIFGVPWIAWVHDAVQGKKGGTSVNDGGAVWSLIESGKLLGYSDARLAFAVSESPKAETAACLPTETVLCLDDEPGDSRFAAEVDFATVLGGGASGAARSVDLGQLGVDSGGLFYFFRRGNPEVLVKVLDGCPVNGHYWVFVTAGTNVGLEVRVEDTARGLTWMRSNPDLTPAQPIQDTSAFPCGEIPGPPGPAAMVQ
jgi:hypothetical protein